MKIPFLTRAQAQGLARTSGATLENDDRVAWQSARTRNGILAPLPLTEAQAWREAGRHIATIHQLGRIHAANVSTGVRRG